MRIGIIVGARQEVPRFDELVQIARQAEEGGLHSMWFVHRPTLGYDALTAIALLGRDTGRLELGTAVVPVYPYHPVGMAQHALTAQTATGGRLTLGLGLSHRPMVEEALGLSYAQPARHMREYLSVLRPLIASGHVDFAGQVFRVKAEMRVPGATPCSVLIAALAPLMLRVAGEFADGTITWMAGRKTIESHIVPRITQAASAAGRSHPRVCVALPIAITDNAAVARQQAATDFQRYGQLVNYRRVLDLEGAAGPADVALLGNEAEVERQLRTFATAGATDFLAAVFPVGADGATSTARTWEFLKGVAGKL
jgi:5,10-methylenetetrahydromethanopterin reductase